MNATRSPASAHYPQLLGDIGGTNARFALIEKPGEDFSEPMTLPTSDYASLADAIEHYLRQNGNARPRVAALGIANPVTGDRIKMTNHHWSFSIEELRQQLGLARLSVINDFTALALSLPRLPRDRLVQVGGGQADPTAAIALIGPGTGLGVSGLLPCGHGDQHVAIRGEGGHTTLPALDAREAELIALLRERHGHVSAERVISGPGLESLYLAVAQSRGQHVEALAAVDISRRALSETNRDALCREALDSFCGFLGSVAGNLALTLGAFGGVYLGGGIVPKLGDYFAQSPFRERFEAKGRFKDYLARVPAYVIHAPYPALIGAARQLELLGED